MSEAEGEPAGDVDGDPEAEDAGAVGVDEAQAAIAVTASVTNVLAPARAGVEDDRRGDMPTLGYPIGAKRVTSGAVTSGAVTSGAMLARRDRRRWR